jgi:hypothetical protein
MVGKSEEAGATGQGLPEAAQVRIERAIPLNP